MILVALAVIASAAAGAAAARARRTHARALARGALALMLYALVPFVTFFNIAHLHVSSGVGAGIGLGYLELALVGILAWLAARRWLALPAPATGALICTVVLVNTGYLGIPLAAAVLGTSHLPAAIAFDALVSGPMLLVVGFAVGAAFGARAGASARQRARSFVSRNPPLLAVGAALLAPAGAAPAGAVHASHVVVYALLPLGFFVLGVFLEGEAEEGMLAPRVDRAVATALALRLAVAPALMLALSAILVSVPRAYLLQAAMPSGINGLLVAHTYGLDLRLTATAIAWSTALVMAVGLVATAAGA